jgi:hypothetical protein
MMFRLGLQGLLLVAAGALFAPLPALHAQSTGAGFLFREPFAQVNLHAGFQQAGAGGDLHPFFFEQLTLERRDFSGPHFSADLSIRVLPRLDLAFGAGYSRAESSSEFRDWVDEDDLPIVQTTRFERVPLTASAKAYLLPRGRSVGSLAYIPARFAPYVGAGAGMVWYSLQQQGEFVDFESLDIFPDDLGSTGWAPIVQGMAGMDLSLTPRLGLTTEARYSRASAQPSGAFDQFDSVDLSGLALSVGIHVKF